MAFNSTNPVTVGAATKKDHYDRVFDNTLLLKTSISDDGLTWSGKVANLLNAICDGRLTLTSGTPVTTSDVTAATTVYFTPNGNGNRIALYDGSAWQIVSFSELSIALGSDAANTNYDVFAYLNAGAVAIERLAWTNDTTRATALALQNGVWVKSGDATRRYLGSYRTTSTIGQTEDSELRRFVFNASSKNRARRSLRVIEATDNWTYTTATFRQVRASTANQVGVLIGLPGAMVELSAFAIASNSGGNVSICTAIGEDSTSTPIAGQILHAGTAQVGINGPASAHIRRLPAVGYHFYVWQEFSGAAGTTTWVGDDGVAFRQTGMIGSVMA